MNIQLFGKRIMVKDISAEDRTEALNPLGIYLAPAAQEPNRTQVEVVQIGTDVTIPVKAGDTVIVSKYAGDEIVIEGEILPEKYKMLDEKDIMAKLE